MGKITKVPNGPLIKKKGPFKGSTLKKGGVIKKAQDGFNKVKPGTKQTTPKFHVPESRFVITNDTAKVKPTRWINNPMPSDDDDNPFKVVKDVLRKKDMTNKKTGGPIKKAQNGKTTTTKTTKKPIPTGILPSMQRLPIKSKPYTDKQKDSLIDSWKKKIDTTSIRKNGGPVKKAKNGTTTTKTTIKPDYSNIRGGGFNYFKTPTAKDSSDYRKGFDKKLKGEELKQYNKGDKKLFPSPSSSEIRGYNEASERIKKSKPRAKAGAMIKRADGSMSKRGLWDNIRANKGSGKKPTKQMLVQEKKIKAKSKK